MQNVLNFDWLWDTHKDSKIGHVYRKIMSINNVNQSQLNNSRVHKVLFPWQLYLQSIIQHQKATSQRNFIVLGAVILLFGVFVSRLLSQTAWQHHPLLIDGAYWGSVPSRRTCYTCERYPSNVWFSAKAGSCVVPPHQHGSHNKALCLACDSEQRSYVHKNTWNCRREPLLLLLGEQLLLFPCSYYTLTLDGQTSPGHTKRDIYGGSTSLDSNDR